MAVVSSLDYEESSELDDFAAPSSFRFDAGSAKSSAKIGPCSSSRFAFTVSHHFDSVKPWYLSLTDTPGSKVSPASRSHLGDALISPHNARSFSFASCRARTPPARGVHGGADTRPVRKSLFSSTPLSHSATRMACSDRPKRTPRPSFLQSPAWFFRKDSHVSKAERGRESFQPFLKFYRRPYDEMTYRSKMKPPLGGLISIVSPQLRRRHMSVSQRF